jgi:ribosomal protein S18 acetylase RimI-like enzyme
MHVRAATETDLEALVDLNAIVQRVHAEFYPDDFKHIADPLAVAAFFKKTLAAPLSAIAIAEANDVAVGYVWLEIQARPETPFTKSLNRVYVHHIAVSPAARRQGAATALMRYVEEQAASNGFIEIALDTWAANRDALDFFASQGFTPFRIMQRRICK